MSRATELRKYISDSATLLPVKAIQFDGSDESADIIAQEASVRGLHVKQYGPVLEISRPLAVDAHMTMTRGGYLVFCRGYSNVMSQEYFENNYYERVAFNSAQEIVIDITKMSNGELYVLRGRVNRELAKRTAELWAKESDGV